MKKVVLLGLLVAVMIIANGCCAPVYRHTYWSQEPDGRTEVRVVTSEPTYVVYDGYTGVGWYWSPYRSNWYWIDSGPTFTVWIGGRSPHCYYGGHGGRPYSPPRGYAYHQPGSHGGGYQGGGHQGGHQYGGGQHQSQGNNHGGGGGYHQGPQHGGGGYHQGR